MERTCYRGGVSSRGVATLAVAAVALGGLAVVAPSTSARPGEGPVPPQPKMSAPLLGLNEDELERFEAGLLRFATPITIDQGLGPIFNKAACFGCHGNPLGGSGPFTVTRFGHDDGVTFDPLTEYGGPLLQSRSNGTGCEEVIPAEANVTSLRAVNGSFGYGLIEAIPDADIIALEQDPPGISGRAHMVDTFENPGVPRVGRFGWKAQVATILTFSADAALNEIGFTNRFLPDENDPNGVRAPTIEDCDTVPDVEDGPDKEGLDFIDRVTDFQRLLAAPPQTPRSGMAGETIFNTIGCGDCHTPSFTTADDPMLESALRNKAVRPYSDFLLHDMGDAGDGIEQGDASTTELRTSPLWGLRRRTMLWHDGRFDQSVFEDRARAAIEEHGATEAESVGVHAAWTALSTEDQDRVIAFLGSLGRLEFDFEGEGAVILDDFVAFMGCFNGPGGYTADDPCGVMDIDQDGDADADDYASFLLAYDGTLNDCNENGEIDLNDIFTGKSEDKNGNGIPDECEACSGDINDDGMIGFADVLAVLAEWGACPGLGQPCPWDLDDNGFVGFGDVLIILANWGPCE